MQYTSKIALAAVAFASAVRVVTAAPASIGFGNNTGIDNDTFVIQSYITTTCTQDSALWVAAQTPTALMTIAVNIVDA